MMFFIKKNIALYDTHCSKMKIGLPNLAFKFPGVPTVEGRLLNTIDQTISITNFVPL